MKILSIPTDHKKMMSIAPKIDIISKPQKLILPIDKIVYFIDFDTIVYAHSEGNYVHVITNDNKYFLAKTLKWVEKQLPKGTFLRIHRTYLVNKTEITQLDRSSWKLTLSNNISVPISRNYKNTILGWLSK